MWLSVACQPSHWETCTPQEVTKVHQEEQADVWPVSMRLEECSRRQFGERSVRSLQVQPVFEPAVTTGCFLLVCFSEHSVHERYSLYWGHPYSLGASKPLQARTLQLSRGAKWDERQWGRTCRAHVQAQSFLQASCEPLSLQDPTEAEGLPCFMSYKGKENTMEDKLEKWGAHNADSELKTTHSCLFIFKTKLKTFLFCDE